MTSEVRSAAVAGSWYPGDSDRLISELERHLGAVAAGPAAEGRLIGLVCPHAGLVYSGPVAAWGYSLLRGRKNLTVVLVGPSHHCSFDGIALSGFASFETPLGLAPVDEELATALERGSSLVMTSSSPHREEHCLEMQLPFLQHLVPGLRIVPLLMGRQSPEVIEELARVLGETLTGRNDVLLVASSDLSHYKPAPVAHRLDGLVAGDIERFDEQALLARLGASHSHACGGGPIVAVMKAARLLGANRARVLRYGHSGEVGQRDENRVVGYLSAAFFGR